MSDSDETVCEGTEDSMALTDSLMSPSIMPPVTRTNSAEHFCGDNQRVKDLQSSPEFPPPSAKIKRQLNETWQDCTTPPQLQNTDVSPNEKLRLIKGDEDKMEELLACLELKAMKGNALKGDSVFAEVKALMSKTRTQLCEFSRYQQQERKKITKNGDEFRCNQDNTGAVQWNIETKEKLMKLAAQQKMLLTLFKRHKELLEKIHILKPKLKEQTAYSLPSVEMHWNLQDNKNIQRSLGSEQSLASHDLALNNPTKNSCKPKTQVSISSSSSSHSRMPLHKPSVLSTSNLESVLHTASVVQQTTSRKESGVSSIPTTNESQYTPGTSPVVSTSSRLQHVPPLAIKKSQQIPSTETQVVLSISQVGKFSTALKHVPPIAVSNHQSVSSTKASESTSNSLQTGHIGKNQGVVHDVTFTAGQCYQIGGHKVYVLPQRSITCIPSTAQTQMNNLQCGTVPPVSCLSTVPQNSFLTIVPLSQESSQQRDNTDSDKSSCKTSTKTTHESGLQKQWSKPQTTMPNNASQQSMTITVPAIHDQLASCRNNQINSPEVVSSEVQHISNKSTAEGCGLPSPVLQMKQIVGVNQLMNCAPTVVRSGGVTGTSQSVSVSTEVCLGGVTTSLPSRGQHITSARGPPTVISQGVSGTPQRANRSTLPTVVSQEGVAGTSQSGCQQTVSTYCGPTLVSRGIVSGTLQSANQCIVPTVASQAGTINTLWSRGEHTVPTYTVQRGVNGKSQSANQCIVPKCCVATVANPVAVAGTTSQSRRVYASYSSKGPVSTNQGNSFQSMAGHTLQRRNSFGTDLPDLKSLLTHSVIHAGSNVLTVQYQGRKFEASLRANGLIESAGGETFRTPSAWVRAVTGSWNTIKASHAFNMVHYKGKPLAMFTLPPIDKGCHENNNRSGTGQLHRQPQYNSELGKGALQTNRNVPQGKNNNLIGTWEDLKQLLTDFQVIPVGEDELVPTERFLPSDFWDSPHDVELPQSIWKELDL